MSKNQMSDEMAQLIGEELVKSENFSWKPGMVGWDPSGGKGVWFRSSTVVETAAGDIFLHQGDPNDQNANFVVAARGHRRGMIPDIRMAVNKILLLEIIRERASDPSIHVRCRDELDMRGIRRVWRLFDGQGRRLMGWLDGYDTEGEAIAMHLLELEKESI